jgi:serine phosphatase RsbU (regulator of sigma subunit)
VVTLAPAPSHAADPESEPHRRTDRSRRHLPSLVVLVLGLLITAVLAWTCWTVNDRNETRLLRTQVQEGGTLLAAALPAIETPLTSAVDIAQATGGDPAKFSAYMGQYVGAGRSYASVSLFDLRPVPQRIALVGAPPLLGATSPQVIDGLTQAERSGGFIVTGLFGTNQRRVTYTFAGPGSSFAVYGETALPPREHLQAESNAAFSDLDYAIYIGRAPVTSHLIGATQLSGLPLSGRTVSTTIPVGNSAILLVARPAGDLGGSLLNNLFWIVALAGVALTLIATLITELLVRDRRFAEQLAIENRVLYSQQRGIAQTLQRALLPEELPPVPGLEVGVRYRSGVEGIDVGGDWCDVVELGPSRALLVVGDVSGRGLDAATTMASLHYSIRAYAREGDSPSTILTKLSKLVRLDADRQFASVLCGIVDVAGHRLTLANAGHLPPLLVADSQREFVTTGTGAPIGVDDGRPYIETTIEVPAGSTLLAFTDGLVERRGETIDEGMERLRASVPSAPISLGRCLDEIVETMLTPSSHDDTAILGVRWTT